MMNYLMAVLTSSRPFSQWSATDVSDILWLVPWVVVILLLATAVRVMWRALMLVLMSGAAALFVILVVFYLVTGV